MTGKQRVEEILQKYSNAVVDEAVEKCVGGGIVVFAERAKAKRLEALDSIEEVIKEVLGEKETELLDRVEKEIINLSPDDYSLAWTLRQAQNTKLKELRKLSAKNQMGRWESK